MADIWSGEILRMWWRFMCFILLFSVCAGETQCDLNNPITRTTSCPCNTMASVNIPEGQCTVYRTVGPNATQPDPVGCASRKEGLEFILARNLGIVVEIFANPIIDDIDMWFNVTVTLKDERVRGFALHLDNHGHQKKNICRYFDFRKANVSLDGAKFVNSDLKYPTSDTGSLVNLDVAVFYDENEPVAWSRFSLTPIYKAARSPLPPAPVGSWKSLVVVDLGPVDDCSIDVMFSAAPFRFDVPSYSVQLLSVESDSIERVVWRRNSIIVATNSSVGRFSIPDPAQCTICKVQVRCDAQNCSNSTSAQFHHICPDTGTVMVVGITVGALAILTAAVMVFVCVRKKTTPAPRDPVKVFIAYSYDVRGHGEVVERFAQFLQSCCRCEVSIDQWDLSTQDPDVWVRERIEWCDYVIIVWSRGACLLMDTKNRRVLANQPGYLANFGCTMAAIETRFRQQLEARFYHRNLNKFVNVSFGYGRGPRIQVAQPFDMQPHARLPGQIDQLLCRLHCTTSHSCDLFTLTGGLCRGWGPAAGHAHPLVGANLTVIPEGRSLVAAVDSMRDFERSNVGWFEALLIDAPSTGFLANARPSVSESDSGADELRRSAETDETDAGDSNDENDERYGSSSLLNFPPHVDQLPVYGPDAADQNMVFQHGSRRSSDDSAMIEIPDDVFGGIDDARC